MSFASAPGTLEAMLEVCAAHLGQAFADANWVNLYPESFLDLDEVFATNKRDQKEALRNLGESLRASLLALEMLHPYVRRSVEWQVTENMRVDAPLHELQILINLEETNAMGETEVKSLPVQTHDMLERMIRTSLSAFLGVRFDQPNLSKAREDKTRSAFSASEEALSEFNMQSMTGQAKKGEAWQKARTFSKCRAFWEQAKGVRAPQAATGPFGMFLGDVIDALGKRDEWKDPRSLERAWKETAGKGDFFL